MAEIMEDDEMIVLIIGDEEVSKNSQNVRVPCPVAVKQEPLDMFESKPEVDEIIRTATKHGEFIDIKVMKKEYDSEKDMTDSVSFEEKYSPEFSQDGDKVEDTTDTDAENNALIKDEDSQSGVEMEFTTLKYDTRKGRKKGSQKKISLINQLRQTDPKMRKDPKLLVEHLVRAMKSVKAPILPLNHCAPILDKNRVLKYKCSVCSKLYDKNTSASRHYQEIHGVRYLNCFACGADFRRTTNLYKHEKRCPSRDARLVLQARGRFLGRKGRSRPFLTQDTFQPHGPWPPQDNHKPKRLYCTKCPASFRQRQNLIAHENSHEGVRPYQCEVCAARYTSETGLQRHVRLHYIDSLYICDHCGRKFKVKGALISHQNTHRTIPKYACNICERRFAHNVALKHHYALEHHDTPPLYGCPNCPKRYVKVSLFKDHMKNKHGVTLLTPGMYYKALPNLSDDEAVKTAKLIFDIPMTQITSPANPSEMNEAETKKILDKVAKPKRVRKRKKKNPKPAKEEPSQNICQIVQGSVKSENKEQKVYELVKEKKEKKSYVTDEFLEFVQSKAAPGQTVKSHSGPLTELQSGSEDKANPVENPVTVIRIPKFSI